MIKYLPLQKITAMHGDEIRSAVSGTVDSGWYLLGDNVRRFERDYAAFIGTDCCIACGNGLDALTLIFRAYIEMGVMGVGDEVIVPANTYIASILAVTRCRLIPVLVEPNDDTLQIDDGRIEQAVTPRTRAVMIVHLYGKCAYTENIADICRKRHLVLIEDNAQAHGCSCAAHGTMTRTGALGDAAAHSFYPGKNLGALGDAGAVTTSDRALADTVRALANYGSTKKYIFDYAGLNSRMDELQAAVLSVKLKYIDEENDRRKRIARRYVREVTNSLIRIPKETYLSDNVVHIFPVFCCRRDDLKDYLLANGVETMIHYPIPPHKQRCYKQWSDMSFPVTERIHREELSIPCNQTLTDTDTDTIITLLNNFR